MLREIFYNLWFFSANLWSAAGVLSGTSRKYQICPNFYAYQFREKNTLNLLIENYVSIKQDLTATQL